MNFLFIKIMDEQIVNFLSALRGFLSKKDNKTDIHITISGPRDKKFRRKVKVKQFLEEKRPIKIEGVGRFMNDETNVIYLKAKVSGLRTLRLWNKPDYPDYNPHITIYKGADKTYADKVYNFLEKENIFLETYDYQIVPYCSNQLDAINKINTIALYPEVIEPTQKITLERVRSQFF